MYKPRLPLSAVFIATLLLCGFSNPRFAAAQDAAAAYGVQDFSARDPFQPVNKAVFAFNLEADKLVFRPIERQYSKLPDTVRDGVNNFMQNLGEPLNFINGVLQLKPRIAMTAAGRFFLNTTAGIAGFRDYAQTKGFKYRDEGFSKTLARYGVKEGDYIVLPILGPSTARGTAGLVADYFVDPVSWFTTTPEDIALASAKAVNGRDRNNDAIDEFYYQSIAPYATTRAAYLQHQAFNR
ncbi:MAG: VacJ family lipoprotein [Alphaproteobacteria bacterium]|nr:VacJ family lipoprotein [Alphaproteobacteria bacterium]MDE2336417.1 VacJ family lipoprotein [Alphaproteobacteria bacterium]